MYRILFLVFATLPLINLSAQQIDTLNQFVISNAGQVFQSDNYILNFTIGESIIGVLDKDGRIISQGFHQPKVEINASPAFEDEVLIFPNPTKGEITLEFQFSKLEEFSITLVDVKGKQLKSTTYSITNESITINLSSYPKGYYFLKISNNKNNKKRTFKIVKN